MAIEFFLKIRPGLSLRMPFRIRRCRSASTATGRGLAGLWGFNLVMDPSAYSFPVSAGTIWWDGSAGTRYFIDSTQGIITVIMAQVSPSRGGGFREDFTRLVDAALIERR